MSFSSGAAAGRDAPGREVALRDDDGGREMAINDVSVPRVVGARRGEDLEAIILAQEPNDSLRLLTCGSVDDGKSTLIGRMLWEAADLHDDQRAQLIAESSDGTPEFARLLDGLSSEREQGITIDIAWRYFDAGQRRYVIIDSPGHEQYTRNMASGASHADVAILLVDARHGIKPQTRRHAAILDLMGVSEVIVAVNKMDLVDFSEDRFSAIEAGFKVLAGQLGFVAWTAIPLAALSGDNVTLRSQAMAWYTGPTLLERLEATPPRVSDDGGAFRFPVQSVFFDRKDFRGLAGTVAAGCVSTGDRIVDASSGQAAGVLQILTMDGPLDSARKGQAVVIELDHDLDIARGAVLSKVNEAPKAVRDVTARLVWLSEDAFDPGRRYLVRTIADTAPVDGFDILAKVDLQTLALSEASTTCAVNDIVVADLRFSRPVVVEPFGGSCGLGGFMLVDQMTGASVAGGIVSEIEAQSAMLVRGQTVAGCRSDVEGRDAAGGDDRFVIDADLLRQGLCCDLGQTASDRLELERRAIEVGRILTLAGVSHSIDIG